LWIPDLAESDPFMIAPVLMGAMMYLSQLMMPKPPQTEGMQAQISRQMMIVFPPMLTLIFLFMPAGVVIYSVINMALSIIPQAIILRRVDGGGG
jgi:YidC/Oxa1 family membrane protein insertase